MATKNTVSVVVNVRRKVHSLLTKRALERGVSLAQIVRELLEAALLKDAA